MKFKFVVGYDTDKEDVIVELIETEPKEADRLLATGIANIVYNCNGGTYFEKFRDAILTYTKDINCPELALLIMDEWQRMMLHNDTLPEVSAREAAKINHAF